MECGNCNKTAGVVGRLGRAGTVVDWDGQSVGSGGMGGQKYQQMIYISWVCVQVWAFLRGGGRGKIQGVVRPTHLIRFGTYNIRNGRNRGLESALRGMSQANINLRLFQETNLTKRIDTHESSG